MSEMSTPESDMPQPDVAEESDLHPWPRPINSRALGLIKTALGFGAILIMLTALVPSPDFGSFFNRAFTVVLIVSWTGPGLKLIRELSKGRGKSPRQRRR